MTTPYRVPAGTTEITYTRGSGEQRSIAIRDFGDGYLFAQAGDAADDAHLATLGFPVARKVLGEQEDESAPVKAASKKRRSRTTKRSASATTAVPHDEGPASGAGGSE